MVPLVEMISMLEQGSAAFAIDDAADPVRSAAAATA